MSEKSVVKRLNPDSIAILKEYDPSFMVTNQSPDAAIATMKALIVPGSVIPPAPKEEIGSCKFDENRLLKRMYSVVQEACTSALEPFVK